MQVLPFRADSCLLVYLSENAYALKMMDALCSSSKLRINIRVLSATIPRLRQSCQCCIGIDIEDAFIWKKLHLWMLTCIRDITHVFRSRRHRAPESQPFLTFDPFPIRFVRSNEPKPQKFRMANRDRPTRV